MNEVFVTINGVDMTEKEYKAYRKEKLGATTKKARNKQASDSVTSLKGDILAMVKPLALFKSLLSYRTNAYRQWGTIADTIMENPFISSPFCRLCINIRKYNEILGEIESLSSRADKDCYMFVERLSWVIEDIIAECENLNKGVIRSGVYQQFGSHEAINGNGRRLGLRTLMRRISDTSVKAIAINSELQTIAKQGMNVFEYSLNGRRVWR